MLILEHARRVQSPPVRSDDVSQKLMGRRERARRMWVVEKVSLSVVVRERLPPHVGSLQSRRHLGKSSAAIIFQQPCEYPCAPCLRHVLLQIGLERVAEDPQY